MLEYSLPYEQVLKYELTREKVFKRLGLPPSSSKLWRIQSEPKARLPLKPKVENQEVPPVEYIERLSCSHETTLKYFKLVQDMFEGYEKLNQSMSMILNSSAPTSYKASQLGELEHICYKDLSKFKEMDFKEAKLLESCCREYSQIQKKLHSAVLGVEEKCVIYEKNLKSLEEHVDSIIYKSKVERDECQGRLQELLETCHDYSEQIEKLKQMSQENSAAEKKLSHFRKNSIEIEKNNIQLVDVVSKLEGRISELTKELDSKDCKIERLSESLRALEGKSSELKKELTMNEKVFKQKFDDEIFLLESQVSESKHLMQLRETELDEARDKVKFLQDELSSYKFNRDQESKSRLLEARELQELRLRCKELKDQLSLAKADSKEIQELKHQCKELKEELAYYKPRIADGKDIQELKAKNSELKDELNFYKSKNLELQDLQEVKIRKKNDKTETSYFKGQASDSKELNDLKIHNLKLKEELSLCKSKINEIREEMLLYKNQCLDYKEQNSDLKLLCTGVQEQPSRHFLATLQDSLHKICERFSKDEDNDDWKEAQMSDDFSQLLNEIEFVSAMVNKLANDNDWLVDRLSELGQENLRLKEAMSPKRIIEDEYAELKATSNAMKEFENSRSRIFYKFSD